MPIRAPRICGCGHRIAHGTPCPCEERKAAARKARHDAGRPQSRDRGYDSKWRKARDSWLSTHPTCTMCGQHATVVDHIVPHRGDKRLFWSQSNWQALCTHCHSGPKQRAERALRGVAAVLASPAGTGGGKRVHD